MGESRPSVKLLEKRIAAWAEDRPDIRIAFVVGSQARQLEHPADEWSDLDIVIFTTDPDYYLSDSDWASEIDSPLLSFIQNTPVGGQCERRILFENGGDVDFTIVANSEAKLLIWFLRFQKRLPHLLQLLPKGKLQEARQAVTDFASVIRRGVRVLVDKDGVAVYLPFIIDSSPSVLPRKPSQAEFIAVFDEFWYLALLTTKKIRRGALWTAIGINNCSMKSPLLRMLEWRERAVNGWDFDTWHSGSFIEHWAEPQILNELSNVFTRYEEESLKKAVMAMIDLFRSVSLETAKHLQLSYPTAIDEHMTKLIKTYLSESV